MNSIKRSGAHHFESHIEGEIVILHIIYKTLQVEQSCVPLVAVVEICLDAQFIEHEHAADAEQIFLFDAVLPVAAVELMRNLTVEFRVAVKICVEQI